MSRDEKPCTTCKVPKPFTAFYPRSDQPGKFTSSCADCINAKARAKAAAKRITRSTITVHPDGYALVSLHGKHGEGKFAKIDVEDIELVSSYKWGFKDGYARAVIGPKDKRRDVMMHRLILGLLDVPANETHTDHKHHDTLDNRRSELRQATPKQNNLNGRGYGASGYKGVYKVERSPNWRVVIAVKRNVNHGLGTYAAKEDAARVYDGAARALFGKFAFTNFPALPTKKVA